MKIISSAEVLDLNLGPGPNLDFLGLLFMQHLDAVLADNHGFRLGQYCIYQVFALDHASSSAFFHLLVQLYRVRSCEFLTTVRAVLSLCGKLLVAS